MDKWKYYDITHRHHLVCNPTSIDKLDQLIDLFKLKSGARVLDIACGKGEMLARLAEVYGISGVGVDLSPFFIADARKKLQEGAPDAEIKLLHMDGADYQPLSTESFDLTMCIGASWIFKGHRGTLRALRGMAVSGGLVLVGEPFWVREPEEEYLVAAGMTREMCTTHYGNVAIGEEEGLVPLYTMVSNQDDWDRYETLQWYASAEYASANPEDRDVPKLLSRVADSRTAYLKWGRDTLSWALYLFRKSPDSP